LIADLDTGVDWRHPDFWFAESEAYPYVNATSTGFLNGTDAVDLNRDTALSADETPYALDPDGDGLYQPLTEWLWVDNITQNALPDLGEPFFVVNNALGNGKLDVDAAVAALLADSDPPVFETHSRAPFALNAADSVTIRVNVTDASGVDTVILSYYNGSSWLSVTMTWDGSSYVGVIPAFPLGTQIDYKMYAKDTLGNWAVTPTYSYTVGIITTTTTVTTTTTITTPELDYLMLALMLSAVLIVIVLFFLVSRRRTKKD
jgi:hypothetical protein